MVNKYLLFSIVGGVSASFIAYCIYFDRKRRNDPNFKSKLREKRAFEELKLKTKNEQDYPDLSDATSVQNFFIKQMQLGEQSLNENDIENATEHFANAILISPNKAELLSFFRFQWPDQVYEMVLTKMPLCGEKLLKNAKLKSQNDFKIETEKIQVTISEENLILEEPE